jgi:hypothetical protein
MIFGTVGVRCVIPINQPAGRAAGISAARGSRPKDVRRTHADAGGIPYAANVCMRTTTCSALVLFTALLAAAPVSSLAATPERAVLRVHIETRAGRLEGTCVLVHREGQADGTVLYFLTSGRLLKSTDADLRAGTRRIRILRDDGAPIEVAKDSVIVPYGDMVDIAILRVMAPIGTLEPLPMILEPPEPGSVFAISGFGVDGVRATVPERVRFQATLRLLGDRDASSIAGCAGAPAIVAGGAFGLVTECEPDRAPSIVPLSVARSFIVRNMPNWRLDSSQTPVFDVVTRLLTGASVPVGCEATRTGEREIPFALGPGEMAIDATASVIEPRSRHLADVTVLSLYDRTLKLRLTMTGVPLPPFSAPCTPGQALVSVRVNILALARPH